MKRVNLTKYGFERWSERDFHDDGNNFTCFRVGTLEVSKLVSSGQVYLSAQASSCGNGTLPYEIYSKLPYYKEATWKYNGVDLDTLTDADLEAFYEFCVEYEKAYVEEEVHIVYPTIDEIKEQCKKIIVKTMKEIDEIETILQKDKLAEVAIKFSEYDWKQLRSGLLSLATKISNFNPDKYAEGMYKSQYSFNFVKPDYNDLTTPSYAYRDIMERFKKYGII